MRLGLCKLFLFTQQFPIGSCDKGPARGLQNRRRENKDVLLAMCSCQSSQPGLLFLTAATDSSFFHTPRITRFSPWYQHPWAVPLLRGLDLGSLGSSYKLPGCENTTSSLCSSSSQCSSTHAGTSPSSQRVPLDRATLVLESNIKLGQ